VNAFFAYTEYMKQYTIRNIPDNLDRTARKKAAKDRQSLNSVLLEALSKGLNVDGDVEYHDMDDLAGTWVSDPDTDAVLKEFDVIDGELWA